MDNMLTFMANSLRDDSCCITVIMKKFEGRLPYTTKLYGDIQPLLGLLGKRTQNRVAVEQGHIAEYVNRTIT